MTSLQGMAPAATTSASSAGAGSGADASGEGFADALQQARHANGPAHQRAAARPTAPSAPRSAASRGQGAAESDDPSTKVSDAPRELAEGVERSRPEPDSRLAPHETDAPPAEAPWLPPDLAVGADRLTARWSLSEGHAAAAANTETVALATEGGDSSPAGKLSTVGGLLDRSRAAQSANDDLVPGDDFTGWMPDDGDVGDAASLTATTSPAGERFAQALQAAGTDTPTATHAAGSALSALTASSGAAADLHDATAPTAPLAEHEIHTPLHSPGFAPALGAQLTLLVKDGVTEARLHLNPAEMGPIAVQIQLEGAQARVEMVAEQATTRQVLEQSMPSLASALRDSGLTLTGGGVFEQSTRRDPADEPGTGPRRANSAPDGAAAADGDRAAAPVRATRPRGVVDLYA